MSVCGRVAAKQGRGIYRERLRDAVRVYTRAEYIFSFSHIKIRSLGRKYNPKREGGGQYKTGRMGYRKGQNGLLPLFLQRAFLVQKEEKHDG